MAGVPVPRQELTGPPGGRPRAGRLPAGVVEVGARLRAGGHAAHLVGGCVRDLLRGVEPVDWDLATDARPARLLELFPGALYENRFATVTVRLPDLTCEITTWRRDGTYTDHRRPDDVSFADRLEDDLARRDFTINAMALALDEGDRRPMDALLEGGLVDPFDGRDDLRDRILRAVGDPTTRFREDALRMLRAARFSATLGMTVEPATLAAIGTNAALAAHVAGERVAAELLKLLAAPAPSVGLRLASSTGLLAAIAPELGRQAGVPQAKIPGDDLWDHTCRTVDAARAPLPGEPPTLRLAALVHDIGKPATLADGHFIGHEAVGADLAAAWLESLHLARAILDPVVHLTRLHMFAYDPGWSDAAVRRFIRRVGAGAVEDLLDLRAADNAGSGQALDVNGLEELRGRCREQLAARVALEREDLAIDGHDLMQALGIGSGPLVGHLIALLLDRVIADPMLNDRARLLALARELLAGAG